MNKFKIYFFFSIFLQLISCQLYQELPERNVLLLTKVPEVTATPMPNNYVYNNRITLTCEDSEATIFYTTNGSTPNETCYSGAGTGTVYIPNAADLKIKAVAKKNGYSSALLELNYAASADLYLQDTGTGWILAYSDKRILQCAGTPPVINLRQGVFDPTIDAVGYTLYREKINISNIKSRNWKNENNDFFCLNEQARVFDSCLLVEGNTIIYLQDQVLIQNGVNGYVAWYLADARYYPGVLGSVAQGRFIILYSNNVFQYYPGGTVVENNFTQTDKKIILRKVATGTVTEDGDFKFGNFIYHLQSTDASYSPVDFVGTTWKCGNYRISFTSSGRYSFYNGATTVTNFYHLYGKYVILNGIGGSFVYDRDSSIMTFITSGSQLKYEKLNNL